MKQYIIKVEGMRCGMCESHVNDVVRKVNGVLKVKSSHSKMQTEVICEDNVSFESIKENITKEGYTVQGFQENKVEKGLFGYKVVK